MKTDKTKEIFFRIWRSFGKEKREASSGLLSPLELATNNFADSIKVGHAVFQEVPNNEIDENLKVRIGSLQVPCRKTRVSP